MKTKHLRKRFGEWLLKPYQPIADVVKFRKPPPMHTTIIHHLCEQCKKEISRERHEHH